MAYRLPNRRSIDFETLSTKLSYKNTRFNYFIGYIPSPMTQFLQAYGEFSLLKCKFNSSISRQLTKRLNWVHWKLKFKKFKRLLRCFAFKFVPNKSCHVKCTDYIWHDWWKNRCLHLVGGGVRFFSPRTVKQAMVTSGWLLSLCL